MYWLSKQARNRTRASGPRVREYRRGIQYVNSNLKSHQCLCTLCKDSVQIRLRWQSLCGPPVLSSQTRRALFSFRLFAKNQVPLLVMHEQLQRWYGMGIAETTEVVSTVIEVAVLI